MRLSVLMAVLLLSPSMLVLPGVALADDLTGMWELQAIGQDGTSIQIEQKGDAIMLYRVMYPEFEGQKYKLEHLYKGNIIGTNVSGTLMVRDDPKGQFEPLRPFDGHINQNSYIVVDDLPLKLVKAGGGPLPVKPPEPKRKKRGSDAPPLSQNATEPDSATLMANILGAPEGGSLFEISARIRLPSPADDYERLGDDKVRDKKPVEAIDAFEKALSIDPKRLEIYPTLGKLYVDAKRYPDAKKYLAQALRYDPNNKSLKKQFAKVSKQG